MAIQSVKATINGIEYPLTYSSELGKYYVDIQAPSASSYPQTNHYFPVRIDVVDSYGNTASATDSTPTIGNNLKLFVKEQVKPVATITSHTSGSYITQDYVNLAFTILDNTNQSTGYSGIDPSTITMTSSAGTVGTPTLTAVTGGYSGTVAITDIPDGNVTFSVNGADYDGNTANTAQVTVIIDTVAPSLVVSSPADGYETNLDRITIIGTASDATSSPVTVTISLRGTDQGTVALDSSGHYEKEIGTLIEGENSISVTATDAAGKSTTLTFSVWYSSAIPVISNPVITPNPVDAGTTYRLTVEVGYATT